MVFEKTSTKKSTIQNDLAIAKNEDGKERGYHVRCQDGVKVGQKINEIVRDMKTAEEYRESLVQMVHRMMQVRSLVTQKFKYFWELYDAIIPVVKQHKDRRKGGLVELPTFGTEGFTELPPVPIYESQQKRRQRIKGITNQMITLWH
jgi:hypothetical protein